MSDDLRVLDSKKIVVFSGTSNQLLAKKICNVLSIDLGKARITKFADGEVKVRLDENVRGRDVFIIQPTNPPAEHWDELCFMIDAARRASAHSITAVIPYCGYSRQERKDEAHTSISLKVKLDQVVSAGANRILTVDLHSGASQGFVNISFDNLFATVLLLEQFAQWIKDPTHTCLVTDLGYAKTAGAYAKRLGLELVIARKIRILTQGNTLGDRIDLVGDVKEYALFIDDIADTFGTARKIGEALKTSGAKYLAAAMIHGILSKGENPDKDAVSQIISSPYDRVVFTDSIAIPQKKIDEINTIKERITVVSLAEILARAIKEIFENGSVSQIFEQGLARIEALN